MTDVGEINDARQFALHSLLKGLERSPITIEHDSQMASALGISVTSRVMSSALSAALKQRWIIRSRDTEIRDFYENPIRFCITSKGKQVVRSW